MKLAVISDIHANLPAFEAVLKEMENEEEISKTLCLGDLVGYNPFPNEVIEIIKKEKMECIMGNHDYAVITKDTSWFNYIAADAIKWTIKKIKKENLAFLKKLPMSKILKFRKYPMLLVHGSTRDLLYEYVESWYSEELLREFIGRHSALAMGHTHVPFFKFLNNKLVLNPGAVGQPRDNNPKASYAILDIEKNSIEIKRVEYNIRKTADEIISQGLSSFLAERLHKGI